MKSIVAAVAAAAVLVSALAAADPISAEAEAKRHYEEGTKAFALGEFNRAVTEYRAAYNAKPDPAFLYNIAQSYRLAGDLPQALFFYRSFLNQLPNTPNRDEVERRIQDLHEQVQRQKIITTTPPNTPVPPHLPSATASPASSAALVMPAPTSAAKKKTPAYKKWWVWTLVGVGAAGVAVGLGVGLSPASGPSTHFGTTTVF